MHSPSISSAHKAGQDLHWVEGDVRLLAVLVR